MSLQSTTGIKFINTYILVCYIYHFLVNKYKLRLIVKEMTKVLILPFSTDPVTLHAE